MRLLSTGALALILVAVALVYYVFFALSEMHIASLVPEDMAWGVFYSSVDDLREAYEHPLARRDTDAGRLRLGDRVNVPEFNGIAQHRPFGSYLTTDFEEVLLVPYTDFDAFEEAFEKTQINVNLRTPHRVARNYLSVSRSTRKAKRAKDNRLVLRGLEYPISLVGRPVDAKSLRLMFQHLLALEAPRKPTAVPNLARVVTRMPEAAAGWIAAECEDLVVGLPKVDSPQQPVRAVVEATLANQAALRRAAPIAESLDLAGLVRCFPQETALLLGAALDAKSWKDLGLPYELGDAAVVLGILDTEYRARRYTLLGAVRAPGTDVMPRLLGDSPPKSEPTQDGETPVYTARLDAPPAALATILRVGLKKDAPAVYLSHATEAGIAFFAIGSQAEQAVRHALACRRGAEELSVSRAALVGDHKACVQGTPIGVALVSPAGLKALEFPMPLFEIVGLGQPAGVSAAFRVEETMLRGEIRIRRLPAKRIPFRLETEGGVYKPK